MSGKEDNMFTVENSSATIVIGRAGENVFRCIEIDVTEWLRNYPEGQITAVFERPDGIMYPVTVEQVSDKDATIVRWWPTQKDTYAGNGKLEVRLHNGDMLGKSMVFYTICSEAILYPNNEPVEQNKENMVLMWTETGPEWKRLEFQPSETTCELVVASAEKLGGIMADSKEAGDTQPVRIGADNKLYTAPCERNNIPDYSELENKPSINGVELLGNKTTADLGISEPAEEQIVSAVECWLDVHPEATTKVADGSITYEKLDGVEVVANQLFDPVDFRTNGVTGYLSGNAGTNSSTTAIPVGYTDYMTSPYIAVLPETVYALNFVPYTLYAYDREKAGLGMLTRESVNPIGETAFNRYTTPKNAAYIRFCKRFSIDSGEHEAWMICENKWPYDEYFVGKKTALNGQCLPFTDETVNGAAIIKNTIPANRMAGCTVLQQLFNYDDFINNGVAGGVLAKNGDTVIGSVESYHCSGYVSAKAGQVYTTNFIPYVHQTVSTNEYGAIACYSEEKILLGFAELDSLCQFTTMADTAYVRFGLANSSDGSWDEKASGCMICEGTKVFLGYAEGGEQIVIKNLRIEGSANEGSIPGTLIADGSIPHSKFLIADGLKIVCYGDSLTQNLYPEKVAELLNADVTDAGVGGNTCAGIYDRVGNYGTDFDVVTLMVGTNDNGGQTSCPLGTADDEAAIDDNATASDTTYAARLKRLLNKIKATHRGATFVIMPPFQHSWGRGTFENVSALMGEIAKQYKMPFLDIYHLCGWDGTDEEDAVIFMADSTHENTVGAQRIAELLAGFIKQLKGA